MNVTIDSLIAELQEAKRVLGGGTEVLVPSYMDDELAVYPIGRQFGVGEISGVDENGDMVESEVPILMILPSDVDDEYEDDGDEYEDDGDEWKRGLNSRDDN